MFTAILLLACGAEPQSYEVVNRVPPAFTVVNRVPSPTVDTPPADPRGVWSPWWDGYRWNPRWVQKGGEPTATPFSREPGVTTRPTLAQFADGRSIGSRVRGRSPAATYTLVPPGTVGGITTSSDCPTGVG